MYLTFFFLPLLQHPEQTFYGEKLIENFPSSLVWWHSNFSHPNLTSKIAFLCRIWDSEGSPKCIFTQASKSLVTHATHPIKCFHAKVNSSADRDFSRGPRKIENQENIGRKGVGQSIKRRPCRLTQMSNCPQSEPKINSKACEGDSAWQGCLSRREWAKKEKKKKKFPIKCFCFVCLKLTSPTCVSASELKSRTNIAFSLHEEGLFDW